MHQHAAVAQRDLHVAGVVAREGRARIDLVIDQIVIGWYGALAVEVMKMGKPVVARIAIEDLRFIPNAMASDVQEAIINADPDSIYDVLVRCIEDRAFLRQQSKAGLEYVHQWHDPKYVAGLTKERYEAA